RDLECASRGGGPWEGSNQSLFPNKLTGGLPSAMGCSTTAQIIQRHGIAQPPQPRTSRGIIIVDFINPAEHAEVPAAIRQHLWHERQCVQETILVERRCDLGERSYPHPLAWPETKF